MSAELLLARREAGVLRLTLNRPDRKNAISPDLRDALLASLADARADDEVRAVAITGAGDAFCAGVDLARSPVTERAAAGEQRAADTRGIAESMRAGAQRIVRTIWELDKPVVAAVNGVAAGAGAQVALACDVVIAAESARFIELFVRRGLVVDSGGGWLLPRLVGMARAKQLVFFGDAIDAAEALRMGLVTRVVADAELSSVAGEVAERLARGPTRALGASKMLLNRAFETDLAAALDAEAAAQALVSTTEDFREGVRAFVEKRDPEFRGR